jgi:hypothetical protein
MIPAIMALALFDRPLGPLARPLITFGRVPLFFYLLQWVTTHTLALVAGKLAGKPTDYLFTNIGMAPPQPQP